MKALIPFPFVFKLTFTAFYGNIYSHMFKYLNNNPNIELSGLYHEFRDEAKSSIRGYYYQWIKHQTSIVKLKQVQDELMEYLRYLYSILYQMIMEPNFKLTNKIDRKLGRSKNY